MCLVANISPNAWARPTNTAEHIAPAPVWPAAARRGDLPDIQMVFSIWGDTLGTRQPC